MHVTQVERLTKSVVPLKLICLVLFRVIKEGSCQCDGIEYDQGIYHERDEASNLGLISVTAFVIYCDRVAKDVLVLEQLC